ncbi:CBS domain-containing protein [Streptomyces sp. NPDC091209]|uniref:CBS domain-containing protein n=1 Tax=Streptomyces sp. NPDC091209 TaxID=3365974 RepID=UPI003828297E
MTRHGFERLPVVDEKDRLVVIVTRRDLLQVFLRSAEEIWQAVRREVFADALRVSPQISEVAVHDGAVTLTGHYALVLDQLGAPGRSIRPVPCRTAGLARQHHGSRTKIRTRCGPTRPSSRRFHPLPQARGDGERVPPADEESAGPHAHRTQAQHLAHAHGG